MATPLITIAPHVGDQRQILVDGRRVAYVSPGRPLIWIIAASEARPIEPLVHAALVHHPSATLAPSRTAFAPELADPPNSPDEDDDD